METLPNNADAVRGTQTPEAAAPSTPSTDMQQLTLRTNLTETDTGAKGAYGAYVDAGYFDTTLVLTADYETGTVIGSLEGVSSNRDAHNPCLNEKNEETDSATTNWNFTYSAQVDGTLDVGSGAFSATISPSVNEDFDHMIQPYTVACQGMNDFSSALASGSGTISGVISPTGQASVTTDWQYEGSHVTGSWSGQIEP